MFASTENDVERVDHIADRENAGGEKQRGQELPMVHVMIFPQACRVTPFLRISKWNLSP